MRKTIWSGLAALSVICATADAQAAVPKTYYIDEVTTYPGSASCYANATLNDVTSSLQTALSASGFTGYRYTNSAAYWTDFADTCPQPNGGDSIWGDAKSLTVFAGHAGANYLQFGYKNPSVGGCDLTPQSMSALGMLSGGAAVSGVFLGCDVLSSTGRGAINGQWLRQAFGWANTIPIGNDEPAQFFNLTAPYYYTLYGTTYTIAAISNVDAWLSTMDGGGRHPVTITYGVNSSETNLIRSGAQLKSGNIMYHREAQTPACVNGVVTNYPSYWIYTEEVL